MRTYTALGALDVRANVAGIRFSGHALGRPFHCPTGKTLFGNRFLEIPETEAAVRLVKYPAGLTKDSHTHPCTHGCSCAKGCSSPMTGFSARAPFIWNRVRWKVQTMRLIGRATNVAVASRCVLAILKLR
jgi:hypothetical protein